MAAGVRGGYVGSTGSYHGNFHPAAGGPPSVGMPSHGSAGYRGGYHTGYYHGGYPPPHSYGHDSHHNHSSFSLSIGGWYPGYGGPYYPYYAPYYPYYYPYPAAAPVIVGQQPALVDPGPEQEQLLVLLRAIRRRTIRT